MTAQAAVTGRARLLAESCHGSGAQQRHVYILPESLEKPTLLCTLRAL